MNRINPAKLCRSKWTATTPERGEKHFMVTGVSRDRHDNVLEAVLSFAPE